MSVESISDKEMIVGIDGVTYRLTVDDMMSNVNLADEEISNFISSIKAVVKKYGTPVN